jgi:molybdopterin converting factor small subunit
VPVRITVKLFASFRTGRFVEAESEYPPGTRIAEVASALGIAAEDIGIIMVDNRMAKLDARLHEGAKLALFPLLGGG